MLICNKLFNETQMTFISYNDIQIYIYYLVVLSFNDVDCAINTLIRIPFK